MPIHQCLLYILISLYWMHINLKLLTLPGKLNFFCHFRSSIFNKFFCLKVSSICYSVSYHRGMLLFWVYNYILPLIFHFACLCVCISSVQSFSHVQLFATPWTTARQASLSITNSRSPPKPMSIESVIPFNHLILCRTLLLLPSIFPSIRVFSNESALRIRFAKVLEFQPQYQSFQWIPRTDLL